MKAETVVLVTVIVATTLSAILLSLTTSLAQWANSGASPNAIMWTIIISGALGQGLNQLIAFLSKRFSDWVTGRQPDAKPTTETTVKQ